MTFQWFKMLSSELFHYKNITTFSKLVPAFIHVVPIFYFSTPAPQTSRVHHCSYSSLSNTDGKINAWGSFTFSISLFYTITYIIHSAYVSSEPCAARISPPSSQFVLWTENDFAADADDSHIKHFFFFLLPLGILLKIQVDSVQKYDIILNMFFFLQFCLL